MRGTDASPIGARPSSPMMMTGTRSASSPSSATPRTPLKFTSWRFARNFHRNGIGRTLITAAEDRLRAEGVEYLQAKTLSASAGDKPYLGTLAFYTALDFRVLEEMPSFWDADNPAVVLIKHL
jgi:hypothetical protein